MDRRKHGWRARALLGLVLVSTGCDRGDAGAPLGPDLDRSLALASAPAWVSSPNPNAPELLQALAREQERTSREEAAAWPLYQELRAQSKDRKQQARGNPELLYCTPFPYEAQTQIVGPEGGFFYVGPHTLSIPAGALTQYTVVTAEMPVSANVSVRFSPHGLVFARKPKLTLSYRHCSREARDQSRIFYINDSDLILERPVSMDRHKNGEVDSWIEHFSRYAVGTGRSDASAGSEETPDPAM